MIELIGWIAAALFGAYIAGCAAFFLLTLRWPQIDGVISAFYVGVVTAIVWLGFIAWLSPLTISLK